MKEIDKFKAISKRLNYIQNRLNNYPANETTEAWQAMNELEKELRKFYGEKIAFEISCEVGEK